MKIVKKELSQLHVDPNNVRRHSKANLEAIAVSLTKFGQRRVAVIRSDGRIIAGNGMFEAALEAGINELWCHVVPDDWSDDEARAFAIADNRTAELAKWNQEKLAEALSSVTEDGDAMGEATGFEHEAIMSLLKTDMPEFDPVSEEEQSQLDEKKIIVCPHCGKELGQGFHK